MYSKTFAGIILSFLLSCNGNFTHSDEQTIAGSATENDILYSSVETIPALPGFKRIQLPINSFAFWLRKMELKSNNTVYLYNGKMKANQEAQFAVLNISVGDRNLQQCADAVMRLRAEHLFDAKKFKEIIFTDNDGMAYPFKPPYTRQNFNNYLPKVFGMCGTASLSKQMKSKQMRNILPGDVFVRGGFPGHAAIVVDMATNTQGEKIYLLAQSYMPAQDIHILRNPADPQLSPWYKLKGEEIIKTPEYIFKSNELKGW